MLNFSMVADSAGAARYFIVQIHDISSLVHTETALEESRRRYRALSDATFEAVFISQQRDMHRHQSHGSGHV
jgi:PAS domain-containing protein